MLFESACIDYLRVGTAWMFVFPVGAGEVLGSGLLLGWRNSSYVITELPYHDGTPIRVEPDAPCIVRYMLEGKVVGYRSHVRAQQTEPEPMLFLGYPDKVEEILLRKHPRVPVSQPVMVFPVDGERGGVRIARAAPLSGLLTDLSVQGCRVTFPGAVAGITSGAAVRLEFELPAVGRITNLTGIVKNMYAQEARTCLGLEFRFQQMEFIEFRGWGKTVQKAIEQFIAQHCQASVADASSGASGASLSQVFPSA